MARAEPRTHLWTKGMRMQNLATLAMANPERSMEGKRGREKESEEQGGEGGEGERE